MRHALVILFSLLLALAPAASFAGGRCCCVSSAPDSSAGADEAAASCCGLDDRADAPASDNAPQPDEQPCDGQDCTMVCCSVVKTLCVSHRSQRPVPAGTQARIGAPPERFEAPPHVQRLKRPPRVVTPA